MSSKTILHALGLHLYQPAGNLRKLLREDESELRRILLCYGRLARHAHKYADVARLHVALSPVLLEQLCDPELIEACRDLADIPSILEGLRGAAAIEFVGSGFRHAPLPLIPPEDWDEQLHNERVTMEATLGRVLKGYWPPEGIFAPELIPALVKAGYEYLLLPASTLQMTDGGSVDPYRAYQLCHQKFCLPVVPLDQGFSQAQELGLEAPWFADTVRSGVAQAPASEVPYLLSTWSDGENGVWFRRVDEEHGFFGQFFSPYMEFCETGEFPVRPVFLSEYLRSFRPQVKAGLRVEQRLGLAALDDAGQDVRKKLFETSARYWSLARAASGQAPSPQALLQARKLLLSAEESGMLLGDASRREALLDLLTQAEALMTVKPAQAVFSGNTPSTPDNAKQPKPAATSMATVAPPVFESAPRSKPKMPVQPPQLKEPDLPPETSVILNKSIRPMTVARHTAQPRPASTGKQAKKKGKTNKRVS